MSVISNSEWYISRNGQQIGPISRAQLDELHRSGKLAQSDHVWSAELGDWKLASSLFQFLKPPPPPPPPGRDLNSEIYRNNEPQDVANFEARADRVSQTSSSSAVQYSDDILIVRNGSVRMGGQQFPLQMIANIEVTHTSIKGGVICGILALPFLLMGSIRGAPGFFLAIGAIFLAIAAFNIWANSTNYLLSVYLHSNRVITLRARAIGKDLEYLKKLASVLKSASAP